MRQRSDVDDFGNGDACTMDGTHCGFATVARALEVGLDFAQTQIVSDLGAILRCHLGGIRSVLLAAAEAHLAGRRPGDNLTLAVGKADDDIVERRMNVKLAFCADFDVAFLSCDCFLCHVVLLFSSFLLVSNGFLAALAGAGVVLGALAAYGQAIAVTDTTVATDVHQTLDVELDLAAQITLYFVV